MWKLIRWFCKMVRLVFSYVCVRARAFQQLCCFFAVTSVTRREKNGQKTAGNSVKRKKKNAISDTFYPELTQLESPHC